MREVRRPCVRIVIVLVMLVTDGCVTLSDLNPTTTAQAPNGPVAASPTESIVVFARPPAFNPVRGKLRVIDEHRRVVADLDVNEHAVVSASPGAHEFFAYSWSSGIEQPWCVGALRADLQAGRVYAVRTAQYPSLSAHATWSSAPDDFDFDCHRIELLRIPDDERAGFWSWVRTSSPRRSLLAEGRERSIILDAPSRSERALAAGLARVEKGPAWSASWSALAAADGEEDVP